MWEGVIVSGRLVLEPRETLTSLSLVPGGLGRHNVTGVNLHGVASERGNVHEKWLRKKWKK